MRRNKKMNLHLLFAFCILACSLGAFPAEARVGISFEKRVAAQKTIEEVYWKHTIWPADNPQPKPTLAAVMTDSAIRFKTEEYLRKSYALDSYFQKPITPEKLQAEIDRMARATQNPQMLEELWEALRDDPYLIAECLARPLLVNRIANQSRGFEKHWSEIRQSTEMLAETPFHRYRLPAINDRGSFKSSPLPIPEDNWDSTTTIGAPSARWGHTAVWTGTQMIVWGGFDTSSYNVSSGGRYDPATNAWSPTTAVFAPSPRRLQAAVWTGTQMVVWGGHGNGGTLPITGGRYNPSTDSWNLTTTVDAPSGRESHTTVWTGKEMIVWGGATNTGGKYDPVNNSWVATRVTGAPSPRQEHTAVWTGKGGEMIVWGGSDGSSYLNTGGRYNPQTQSWAATPTFTAPSGRTRHTAVWTGTAMIIWGGLRDAYHLNTGSRYNPATNQWQAITTTDAPSARYGHTAVWTGSRMIIWGGHTTNNGPLNTGARYDPAENSWRETTTSLAPSARGAHTAVWGTHMIVWGGGGEPGSSVLNTGGRYYFVNYP